MAHKVGISLKKRTDKFKGGTGMNELKTLKEAADYLSGKPETVFDPYPQYDDRVMNALNTMKPDLNYLEHYADLEDKAIEDMSLKELATMYTFIQRGERFCDGHIAAFIEDGRLLKLFRRHIELLEKKKK